MGTVLVLFMGLWSVNAQDDPDAPDLSPPEYGVFDPASVEDIDPASYPLLPEITEHSREIYARALEADRNPQVFSRVGDCMTASSYFLTPFGLEDYDLGEYEDLQAAVDYFGAASGRSSDESWELNTFATPSLAAESGFNTASVLDSIWADPTWCEANESPLACEYRVSNAAFSIIMFGTNDVYLFEPAPFDYYLRSIALETINADVVPILSTFPIRPEFPDKSMLFNQIILKIAEDYQLPVMNLWLGLEALPNQGVDLNETIHLSAPEGGRTCVFSSENLETGYTFRNLVVLQTLDLILDELIAAE